jgi:GNAT superfamily N-acetyltransferase
MAQTVHVLPATADRFEDLRLVLGPKRDPDAPACWCLSSRMPANAPGMDTGPGRQGIVRQLCAGAVPPGVLGYVGDEVVGWCSVSPRESYHRLTRSRTIPQIQESPDDRVWSVVCFVVRPRWRRHGVAAQLLAGAVAFAQQHGADVVEGYPVDAGGARVNSTLAFVGSRELFERAGFVKAADTSSTADGRPRVLMRRRLSDG